MNALTALAWVYRETLSEGNETPPTPFPNIQAEEESLQREIKQWQTAYKRWGPFIRQVIVEELEKRGELATLLKEGGAMTSLPPSSLLDVDERFLSFGLFDALPWVSRGWREWQGATILLPTTTAEAAVRAINKARKEAMGPTSGRPHAAPHDHIRAEFARAFPAGREQARVTWKQAKLACPTAATISLDTFKRIIGKSEA